MAGRKNQNFSKLFSREVSSNPIKETNVKASFCSPFFSSFPIHSQKTHENSTIPTQLFPCLSCIWAMKGHNIHVKNLKNPWMDPKPNHQPKEKT